MLFTVLGIFFAMAVEDLTCVLMRDDVGELAVNGAGRYASLFCVLVNVSLVDRGVGDVLRSVFVRGAEVVLSGAEVGSYEWVAHVHFRLFNRVFY